MLHSLAREFALSWPLSGLLVLATFLSMARRKRGWNQDDWDERSQWEERDGRSSRTGGRTPVQADRKRHEGRCHERPPEEGTRGERPPAELSWGELSGQVSGAGAGGLDYDVDEFTFSQTSEGAYAMSKELPPQAG